MAYSKKLNPAFLMVAFACAVFVLTGCASIGSSVKSEIAKDTSSSAERPLDNLEFGPLYPVNKMTDPVVAKTVEGAETRGSPIVSAEIRGFRVQWSIRRGNSLTVRELAVMKDGGLYAIRYLPFRPFEREGSAPATRLTPEPRQEALIREKALASAHQEVIDNDFTFKSAEQAVFGYLVRLHAQDGSSQDVWVNPEANPEQFFYGLELEKVNY